MAHSLSRFSKSILEQPQLILPSRFEEIASVLTRDDTSDLYTAALQAEKDNKKSGTKDLAETEVGVLRIEGALTNKPTMFGALCGLTSYQDLLAETDELASMDSVKKVMMQVDSGGGEAYNLFNTATQIKSKLNEADKKLIAYVDGSSASAAYGLTAVADEVIMHPDAMVGSIGVVVRLTNTSKAEKEAGYETKYITFGASKVPFDEDGEFREEFTSDIQERVNELGAQFISHVASNRGISEDTVESTQAKMFSANKALELGLVDKIMTNEEFYEYLAEPDEQEESTTSKTVQTIKLDKSTLDTNLQSIENIPMNEKPETVNSVDTAAQLAEMQATMKQQADMIAAFQAEKAQEEATKLSASLDQFAFLSEDKEAVVSFLSDSSVSGTHKELLNSVIASAQVSQETITEKAQAEVAVAKEEAATLAKAKEEAELSADAVKEEFASKNEGVEAPASLTTTTMSMKDRVAAVKAKQAAQA